MISDCFYLCPAECDSTAGGAVKYCSAYLLVLQFNFIVRALIVLPANLGVMHHSLLTACLRP